MKNKEPQFLLSPFEQEIFTEIIIASSTDLINLQKKTGRSRSTIRENLANLVKKRYIKATKSDVRNEKSKNMYSPTDKGIYYAFGFLDFDLDESDEKQLSGIENSVPDSSGQRKLFLKQMAKLMIMTNSFTPYGTMLNKEGLIERGKQLGNYLTVTRPRFSKYLTPTDENLPKIFSSKMYNAIKSIDKVCNSSNETIGNILKDFT